MTKFDGRNKKGFTAFMLQTAKIKQAKVVGCIAHADQTKYWLKENQIVTTTFPHPVPNIGRVSRKNHVCILVALLRRWRAGGWRTPLVEHVNMNPCT